MRILDISVPLGPDTHSWSGMEPPVQTFFLDKRRGDRTTGSTWLLNTHHGTHLDAPLHTFVDGGDVETVDLAACLGPCVVVDLPAVESVITHADLEACPELRGARRVLFKTANSRTIRGLIEFDEGYVALDESAARFLVDQGATLVGIDYQSTDRYQVLVEQEQSPVHDTLLGNGCIVLEGLDLRTIDPGEYVLICLPLRLQNGEGSPVRAVLLAPDDPEDVTRLAAMDGVRWG